jgi:hypothetical protein
MRAGPFGLPREVGLGFGGRSGSEPEHRIARIDPNPFEKPCESVLQGRADRALALVACQGIDDQDMFMRILGYLSRYSV